MIELEIHYLLSPDGGGAVGLSGYSPVPTLITLDPMGSWPDGVSAFDVIRLCLFQYFGGLPTADDHPTLQ